MSAQAITEDTLAYSNSDISFFLYILILKVSLHFYSTNDTLKQRYQLSFQALIAIRCKIYIDFKQTREISKYGTG